MEKLGVWRKEGKKARVTQPLLPAQESTEGSPSPHCSAEGGCGRHHRGPAGGRSRSRTGCTGSQVQGSLGCGWGLGWGWRGEARSCSLAPSSGGRQSYLHLPSDLTYSCPPGFQIRRVTTAFLCSDCRPSRLTQGEPKAFKAHRP